MSGVSKSNFSSLKLKTISKKNLSYTPNIILNSEDSSERPCRCEQCNQTFKNFLEKVDHACKPYKCDFCSERFLYDFHFNIHVCSGMNKKKKHPSDVYSNSDDFASKYIPSNLIAPKRIIKFKKQPASDSNDNSTESVSIPMKRQTPVWNSANKKIGHVMGYFSNEGQVIKDSDSRAVGISLENNCMNLKAKTKVSELSKKSDIELKASYSAEPSFFLSNKESSDCKILSKDSKKKVRFDLEKNSLNLYNSRYPASPHPKSKMITRICRTAGNSPVKKCIFPPEVPCNAVSSPSELRHVKCSSSNSAKDSVVENVERELVISNSNLQSADLPDLPHSKKNEKGKKTFISIKTLKNVLDETCGALIRVPTKFYVSYKCIKCYKLFCHIKRAAHHYAQCTNFKRSSQLLPGDIEFICLNCPFHTGVYDLLEQHKDICTSRPNMSITDFIQNYDNAEKSYACSKCGFSCMGYFTFVNHECKKQIEKMHSCVVSVEKLTTSDLEENNVNKIECPDCEIVFYDDLSYKKHQVIHSKGIAVLKVNQIRKEKEDLLKKKPTFQSTNEFYTEFVKPYAKVVSESDPDHGIPDLDMDGTLSFKNQELLMAICKRVLSGNIKEDTDLAKVIEDFFQPVQGNNIETLSSVSSDIMPFLKGIKCLCREKNDQPEGVDVKPCVVCLNKFMIENSNATFQNLKASDPKLIDLIASEVFETSATVSSRHDVGTSASPPNPLPTSSSERDDAGKNCSTSSDNFSSSFDFRKFESLFTVMGSSCDRLVTEKDKHIGSSSDNCISSIFSSLLSNSESMESSSPVKNLDISEAGPSGSNVNGTEFSNDIEKGKGGVSENMWGSRYQGILGHSGSVRSPSPDSGITDRSETPDSVRGMFHLAGQMYADFNHQLQGLEELNFPQLINDYLNEKNDTEINYELGNIRVKLNTYRQDIANDEKSVYIIRSSKKCICASCELEIPAVFVIQHMVEVHNDKNISMCVI